MKGKGKAVLESIGRKRKLKSKEYVAESEGEESAGPSERPKKRTKADLSPNKGGVEYKGKGEYPLGSVVFTDLGFLDKCGHCRADGTRCFPVETGWSCE